MVQGNKASEYVALIRDLLDRGAPIHGIGVQAHMSKGGPVGILYSCDHNIHHTTGATKIKLFVSKISSDPEAIIEVVDQLATLNIPIWVT